MGFDLETTGFLPWMGAEIDLIALSNEEGEKYVLETREYSDGDLEDFFWGLSLQNVKFIGQNIKFDCNFILYHYGVLLRNIFCTQIAAQIIDNGRQSEVRFDLISILQRYLGPAYAIDKEEKKTLQKSFSNKIVQDNISLIPSVRKRQIEYAAEDVTHLIALYHKQQELLEKYSLTTIARLEYKVLPVLSKMEVQGILIDRIEWKNLVKHWEGELVEIEKKLDEESLKLLDGKRTEFKFGKGRHGQTISYDLFGNATAVSSASEQYLNYGSPDQILSIWRAFGETPPKDGEGEFTVGEDAVETYLTETPNTRLANFIELLLQYRELNKLVSTYGDSFLALLDKDSRIHTSYTQTRTETGRLSSKEPNLQNIPASKNPLRDVRKFFIARPGYKLITCDMSGAEVAIAADYSKEPLLLEALKSGADMHSQLASVSFSIIFKQQLEIKKSKETITIDGYTYVLNDLRDEHKSVVFAKFYKAGAKRVYQVLAKYINRHHKPEARMDIAGAISKALDDRMPRLSAYLSGLIEEAQTTGVLTSDKLGRTRFFRPTVYGEAANYPIQGTNANALKIALIKLEEYFRNTPEIDGKLLMNIHDEVVVEVLEEYAEQASLKVKEIMSDALSYFLTDIKGGASVSISQHWKK